MIKRLSKKHILEGMKLCKEYGYWSEEVKEYNDQFYYPTMQKLNDILQSLYQSSNYKASSYYQLAVENNLI